MAVYVVLLARALERGDRVGDALHPIVGHHRVGHREEIVLRPRLDREGVRPLAVGDAARAADAERALERHAHRDLWRVEEAAAAAAVRAAAAA